MAYRCRRRRRKDFVLILRKREMIKWISGGS
jgi:hypothetical protein